MATVRYSPFDPISELDFVSDDLKWERILPQELKIDVTHLPDDTSKKTKNGDKIRVHYVREPSA